MKIKCFIEFIRVYAMIFNLGECIYSQGINTFFISGSPGIATAFFSLFQYLQVSTTAHKKEYCICEIRQQTFNLLCLRKVFFLRRLNVLFYTNCYIGNYDLKD